MADESASDKEAPPCRWDDAPDYHLFLEKDFPLGTDEYGPWLLDKLGEGGKVSLRHLSTDPSASAGWRHCHMQTMMVKAEVFRLEASFGSQPITVYYEDGAAMDQYPMFSLKFVRGGSQVIAISSPCMHPRNSILLVSTV